MSRLANNALAVCLLLGIAATAQAQESQRRPLRIANINVMLFGIGWPTFDHPEFSDAVFPNVSYQRRIARRESRHLPIWVRGAVNFLADDRDFFGYTIWRESDGTPFAENVQVKSTVGPKS